MLIVDKLMVYTCIQTSVVVVVVKIDRINRLRFELNIFIFG